MDTVFQDRLFGNLTTQLLEPIVFIEPRDSASLVPPHLAVELYIVLLCGCSAVGLTELMKFLIISGYDMKRHSIPRDAQRMVEAYEKLRRAIVRCCMINSVFIGVESTVAEKEIALRKIDQCLEYESGLQTPTL